MKCSICDEDKAADQFHPTIRSDTCIDCYMASTGKNIETKSKILTMLRESGGEDHSRQLTTSNSEVSDFRGRFISIVISIESELGFIDAMYLGDLDWKKAELIQNSVLNHRAISFFTKIDIAENLMTSLSEFPVDQVIMKKLRTIAERRNTVAHLNVSLIPIINEPFFDQTTGKGRPSKRLQIDHELFARWTAEAQEVYESLKAITAPLYYAIAKSVVQNEQTEIAEIQEEFDKYFDESTCDAEGC